MDNLTHGLLGASIGMLRRRQGGPEHDKPLTPTDRAVPWATLLAAELPDIDVFFGSAPLDQYVYHRGLTHSLAFTPVVAAVAAGLVKLVWREAKFGTIFLWSWLSVLIAHLLNDLMTGWGTRLLLPFSEARLGLDWVPIIDPLYTLPLILCAIWAWRRPLVRRKVMAGLMIYLALYTFGYRGISQTVVASAVDGHYADQSVAQVQVSPNLFNPLQWQYTVDLGNRFEQGVAYPGGELTPTGIFGKPPEDKVSRAVRQAPELQPFFDQFAFVQIEYMQLDDGTYQVKMGDIRYRRGSHGMGYTVLLSKDLQVMQISGDGW